MNDVDPSESSTPYKVHVKNENYGGESFDLETDSDEVCEITDLTKVLIEVAWEGTHTPLEFNANVSYNNYYYNNYSYNNN